MALMALMASVLGLLGVLARPCWQKVHVVKFQNEKVPTEPPEGAKVPNDSIKGVNSFSKVLITHLKTPQVSFSEFQSVTRPGRHTGFDMF